MGFNGEKLMNDLHQVTSPTAVTYAYTCCTAGNQLSMGAVFELVNECAAKKLLVGTTGFVNS